MPTVNRVIDLNDGESNVDVLQGTVIGQLGPGLHRIRLTAAADADIQHLLKVDSDIAIDDGLIFPNVPLNPNEDVAFEGLAEGGSKLLYSITNESGGAAQAQVQFQVDRIQ
jgi:hypothetical protein